MYKVTIELEFDTKEEITEAEVFSYLKALHEDGEGIDFTVHDLAGRIISSNEFD